MKNAKEMVQRALEIDESNSYVHTIVGEILLAESKYDEALIEYKKAVDLEPSYAQANFQLARCMLFAGLSEKALINVKQAIRLNPHYPWTYPMLYGRICFHSGRYEDALKWFGKVYEICSRGDCNMIFPHIYLAMTYSNMGRDEDAQYHVKKILEYSPKFNLEDRRRVSLFKTKEDTDREIEALRKAGAPETAPSG